MSPPLAVATAVTFVWLGMVLAISFLETPLKFRAPEVTLPVGLGIGRVVFRALNAVEAALAVVLTIAGLLGSATSRGVGVGAVAVVILVVQVVVVRPALARRSDRVLAGEDPPRSRGHYAYIGLEVGKVIALLTTGILLLSW
ncbi:hypothetical protein [Actinomycetospora chibensis]|uniref:Transmembrane protein n=1 Tax=Actinomycetospora chibensis TaxID=663606 RepID=A0ABV9RLX6_9PSEU|nr:hypothetical protein [Actinomycetospora chibensis]MDD7927750.1 hypothetical protein [Actinomycetospora chibensis]